MPNSNKYEIAIIGGGLAGLASAIQLAKYGYSIILFEKNTYPFHKVCGEYISNESYDFIQGLGIPLSNMNLPQINKLRVTSQSGVELIKSLKMGGFGISRYLLDDLLYKNTKALGVTVLENCQVDNVIFNNDLHELTLSTSEKFYSKVVIGSFGKRSNLDYNLKRPSASKRSNFIAVKYHLSRSFDKDLIELHNFEDGYCGISSIENEKLCLCYLTTNHALKKHGTIKRMEEEILMKNGNLKEYLCNSRFLFDKPISISQINFSRKHAVEQHILMVGDTAGLISPLCGNGMSMALYGAQVVSLKIHQYLSNVITRNQLENEYAQFWGASFKTRITIGKFLQSILGNPQLTDITIKALKMNPKFTNYLISLTHGNKF